MPVPKQPLTPSSSTDIASQDQRCLYGDSLLELPPPAIHPPPGKERGRQRGTADLKNSAPTPEESLKRKRPKGKIAKPPEPVSPGFALPPPPTRSRTIIQMLPGASKRDVAQPEGGKSEKNTVDGAKKSNASGTSGKRAARKTAHSVIEKRRRSKMNEEFETMKEMIPACRGQSMHKLAILQAGIEYLRYLEQCVSELKAINNQNTPLMRPGLRHLTMGASHSDVDSLEGSDYDDSDDDEGGGLDDAKSPHVDGSHDHTEGETARSSREDTPQTDGEQSQQPLYSEAMSWTASSVPVSPDVNASAALPRTSSGHSDHSSLDAMTARRGTHKADFEATAALLMLNGQRDTPSSHSVARGLSVKDLLSN